MTSHAVLLKESKFQEWISRRKEFHRFQFLVLVRRADFFRYFPVQILNR